MAYSDILFQTMSVLAGLVISGIITFMLVPPIIKRMKERGITSKDRNKKDRPDVPQLGGIAILFGFSIGVSIAAAILKLTGTYEAIPTLACIGVLFIGGMFGLIDDISDIPASIKAISVSFAALPLMIAGYGSEIIDLPFGYAIDFSSIDLIFWIVVVPIAITGLANAMNLSAGYDGLVTGQTIILTVSLFTISILTRQSIHAPLILGSILGCAIALHYYNQYPAVAFVGNVGTFAFGSALAASIIIGNLEFAGLVAIAPAFYEAFAAVYYMIIKKVDRKPACSNPIIDENGRLHAPKGAEHYTFAYWILSKKPMTEKNLVRTIISIYLGFGILAIVLSLI